MKTRCSDPEWVIALAGELVKRLATYETIPIDNWERLNELTRFDAESFKADVTEETKNIEKEAVHTQVMNAVAKGIALAKSDAGEGGLALGYKGFMLGASGSLAESKAETSAEARKVFADVMKKMGILGEWKGKQYIPKSVDVYTKMDMHRAWSKKIRVEYAFTAGALADHSVVLTKDSHVPSLNRAKEVELVGNALRKELRSELQKMGSRLDELESDLATTKRETERSSRTAERAESMAESAVDDADAAKALARSARRIANDAKRSVDKAINVDACYFEFQNPDRGRKETYVYDLDRNDDIAIVASWKQSCYLVENPTLFLSRNQGDWHLFVEDWVDWHACSRLSTTLVFIDGTNVDYDSTERKDNSDNIRLPLLRSWGCDD